MRIQLIPLDGGRPIEILKDLLLVGRKESCDLFLDHKSVSKLHCVLVKTDGLLMVRDLGSTNGTRVNGQRIRRAALLPNDQLNVASVKFRVQVSSGPEQVDYEERTQQIDAKEVQRMIAQKKISSEEDADSFADIGGPLIQSNALPDVYDSQIEKKKD